MSPVRRRPTLDPTPLSRNREAAIQTPQTPPPTAALDLQRQFDDLHLRFQLQFADHVRLTRDLPRLDRLIADAQALVEESERLAPQDRTPTWQRLFDTADRRLFTYQQARGAIAQAQSVAGLRDRDASVLTGRARLVLHRYVRHFAGHDRRTRDLGRMDEILRDLQQIQEQLRPMAGRIQVPSVAEEISALLEFLNFFHAERGEILEAWRTGSRLDQSESLAAIAENLQSAWKLHVEDESPDLRRPGLVDRLIASQDLVLEALMTLRHANMPDEHEERIAKTARALVKWQDERDHAAGRRADVPREVPPEVLHANLLQRAEAIFARYRAQLTGEHADRDLGLLGDLCDRMDEIERQLTDLEPDTTLAATERLAWVRDVLVAMARTFDHVKAAQVKP